MRNFINIINETHISYGHKISKDAANYTDHSWSGEMCNNCEHYLRPNRCELVDGFIEPGGWCRYFDEEQLVSMTGFEPATSSSPNLRSPNLSYTEMKLLGGP